jgi:hypothetical protein
MVGLLADHNVEGQLFALARLCERGPLAEFWWGLRLKVFAFEHFALDRETSDAALWRFCQAQRLVLVTDNRNQENPESLEAVIRAEGTIASLPTFTLSNSGRIMSDRPYAERVAERLIESLFDIELLRGSGRVFLP